MISSARWLSFPTKVADSLHGKLDFDLSLTLALPQLSQTSADLPDVISDTEFYLGIDDF